MGEEVSGLASLEPLLPLTPPLPLTLEALDTLALPPASGVCSLVLKLETLLMLMTFFISLRVALGVALPLVSPDIARCQVDIRQYKTGI